MADKNASRNPKPPSPGRQTKPASPAARRASASSSKSRRSAPPRRPHKPAIEKELWKPGNLLCPVPAVIVTCADAKGAANAATVAWTGTVCSEPPMLSISLRPATLTHEIISASGQFVVNVPSADLAHATDYCGVASGREINKFERTGLTRAPATSVAAPIILECPVNLECVVKRKLVLGSHTMFVAEITAVQVSKHLIAPTGRLALERAGLLAYAHGNYYALGERLGFYGFSVQKKGKRPLPRKSRPAPKE